MRKYIILVPNDMAFADKCWWHSELMRLFGGFTEAGRRDGGYTMADGRVEYDRTQEYWVCVDPLHDEHFLRGVVQELAKRTRQESIYMEITNPTIEFVKPKP